MSEYKCLTCVHLKPKYDLMECKLQVVRYLKEDKSSWTFDPTCIHDAEIKARRWFADDQSKHDATYKNFPDRYIAK